MLEVETRARSRLVPEARLSLSRLSLPRLFEMLPETRLPRCHSVRWGLLAIKSIRTYGEAVARPVNLFDRYDVNMLVTQPDEEGHRSSRNCTLTLAIWSDESITYRCMGR